MENKNIDEIITNLYTSAEEAITRLAERASETGYVVETSNWVNVGKELGWNGTEFAGKDGILSQYARVFPTLEDAQKLGADYFLEDKNGEPVEIVFTPAADFFNTSIVRLEVLIDFFKCRL